MTGKDTHFKETLLNLTGASGRGKIRETLAVVSKELPKTLESIELYRLCFDAIEKIEDPLEKKETILDFAKNLPAYDAFIPLYKEAVESAITAADSFDDRARRQTELQRIAGELPRTKEFMKYRLQAWRLALDLPDKPRFAEPDLVRIAKELPKANDYIFYRRYTLLGVAELMPKDGAFMDVYRAALELAMKAAPFVEEPYYRKYALMHLAEKIKDSPACFDLYKKAIEDSHKAALDFKDPFAREFALLDIIKEIPKTEDFFPLLQEMLKQSLSFFTVKSWMEDVEIFDVVDYVLSAEDHGMYESKQKRFSRAKYAEILGHSLEDFGMKLADMRFIETLKPFTHVWIRPSELRDSVKKVVANLESLKNTYHGDEIERPVFIKEAYFESERSVAVKKTAPAQTDCVAIDLGATNTVIMRKKPGARPEYPAMGNTAKKYDGTYCIPTVLGIKTNTIGAEVTEETPAINIKQLLLDANPKGKEYMEKFFRLLSKHLKKASGPSGLISTIFQKGIADVLYLTVPVGFIDYKNAIKEIAEKTFKGTKIEFIEEPLAAAIGYEVAGEEEKVVMVMDFGGSTLNTMILRLSLSGVHVVAKPERALVLGGSDIDLWLAGHLALKASIPLGQDTVPPLPLIQKAEEIKIALSTQNETGFQWNGADVCKVTRYDLEEVLNSHDFYRFIDRALSQMVRKAEKIGLKKERIEAILLTGGSSQIPSFKDKIGHAFPLLRAKNQIYDHSPLSAVCTGAAMFGARDVTDKHLGMAYAVRYATSEKEVRFSFGIMLEKGEPLPFEKTFRLTPAKKLGQQNGIRIDLFEVPDGMITRRWIKEEGLEFLRQEITEPRQADLKPLKTITMPFEDPAKNEVYVTLHVKENGNLLIKWGADKTLETGIRLQ